MNTYSHHRLQFEGLESRRLLAVDISLSGSAGKVDLRDVNLDDIASIDICDCGDTTVMLDAQWIGESGMGGAVKVVTNPGDSVKFMDAGWQFAAARADGEVIVREFTNDDATAKLVGPLDFTNPLNAYDVNASGDVTSADVLAVINELDARQFSDPDQGTMVDVAKMPMDQFKFYDVSGNHKITANDALCVINEIARQSNTGDPEADAVVPIQLLARDAVIVERMSSSEDPAHVDQTEKQLIDPSVGLTSDRWIPNAASQPILATGSDSTEEASSLSESLVDSLMLDPTLELCPELEACLA